MSAEEWRSVGGYEGCYEVSNLGRVRSLDRVDSAGVQRRGRVLAQNTNKYGYRYVGLSRFGVARTLMVHHLVLLAFVGDRPTGHEGLHRDGNSANNTAPNLSWGSSSDNAYDRVRHGTHCNSRKTHCPSGHKYTAENTQIDGGSRKCRICKRRRDSARKTRIRLARKPVMQGRDS